jgi:23S rRNA pseudouridine1911/1915/1917 synthase
LRQHPGDARQCKNQHQCEWQKKFAFHRVEHTPEPPNDKPEVVPYQYRLASKASPCHYPSLKFVEKLFEVIHEDDEFLVINKPAGLVCHPTKSDVYSSLISRVRLYFGQDVRPQLINRLDRETSGVTIIAKNEHVARQLRRLWENRQVRKEYVAIVHGSFSQSRRTIVAPLGKDERSIVAIKDCVREDGSQALTDVLLERVFTRDNGITATSGPGQGLESEAKIAPLCFSLLRVVPHTGRKHQIRIHLAHIGHPIVGDKLYGGDEKIYLDLVHNRLTAEQWSRLLLPHHALHASQVQFDWTGRELFFHAEPEPWFKAFCS